MRSSGQGRRMADEPRYWFAARPHRWGYRQPLTWEGWTLDVAFFVIVLAISPYVRQRSHPFQSLGLVFGLFAIYVAIVHWKGEPNDWD
jgi:hypothetical protein